MKSDLLEKIKRAARKPPRVLLKRLWQECYQQGERYWLPIRMKWLSEKRVLNYLQSTSWPTLWAILAQRPYVAKMPTAVETTRYRAAYPEAYTYILKQAEAALRHEVDLLGSGPVALGEKINWHKDYKTGLTWPCLYIKDINYNNPERPSDVKFPWEVSRMQWLIAAGQAYLLTGEERYAQCVRQVLTQWMHANPYARGINWACTMEVAMRVFTWTWFFHVFKHSASWNDEKFRRRFLHCLFLHANFIYYHLEYSDVNGNHYTADAGGLVFAGLFFGQGKKAQRYLHRGWSILCRELPHQVFSDGVDHEASVAYHRLVTELFFLPALYRERCQYQTPDEYRAKIIAMGEFIAAYTRPNGSTPLWGDADDARMLPFGEQHINDHRYLCGIIGEHWKIPSLIAADTGSVTEIYWLCGFNAAQSVATYDRAHYHPHSQAFAAGGFYIMRNDTDHIFIDCGPLGLAGRGGHGHNDCLSFEAMLNNEWLITDCGAYVYTASYTERNHFRSTAYHNTPQINEEEINRFIRWDYLWNLRYDAHPIVLEWLTSAEEDLFCGSHLGYRRLHPPVSIKRTFQLRHAIHELTIQDEIVTEGQYLIRIPLHLAPHVTIHDQENQHIILKSGDKSFSLSWHESGWKHEIYPARISESYGKVTYSHKIIWQQVAQAKTTTLTTIIKPL